jgi:hypothetical protein
MSKAKTEYIWLGSQPLDFGDQRVEPNVDGGTSFSRHMSPEQEASYGCNLVRADRRAAPEKKVTSGN